MARPAPDRESGAGTPRWVKIFVIVAAVLALLVVIALLTDGSHGPGRHSSGQTALGNVVTEGNPRPGSGRG